VNARRPTAGHLSIRFTLLVPFVRFRGPPLTSSWRYPWQCWLGLGSGVGGGASGGVSGRLSSKAAGAGKKKQTKSKPKPKKPEAQSPLPAQRPGLRATAGMDAWRPEARCKDSGPGYCEHQHQHQHGSRKPEGRMQRLRHGAGLLRARGTWAPGGPVQGLRREGTDWCSRQEARGPRGPPLPITPQTPARVRSGLVSAVAAGPGIANCSNKLEITGCRYPGTSR
jgi:hypothetical protein